MSDVNDKTGAFTLASWNVHMGIHNDGGRNDVAVACKSIDADVLVLQEAWWWGDRRSDMTESVATALDADLYEYISPTPLRRYPVRWTVAIISRLPATRLADVVVPGLRNQERRMVRIRLDDSGLIVTGGHLDGVHSLRVRPDVWQLQRRAFRDVSRDTDVIAGDFNMWSPVVARDAEPLRSAVGGRTWPAARPHSQIDHILVSERVEVVAAEVLPDQGSDHRAVKATLTPR